VSESKATAQAVRAPIRGERLMTPDEVAEKLRISTKTVYAMVTSNELPPHKIRGSLRFDSADIDDYIFFSKFWRGNSRLKSSDAEELFERVNSQIEQAKDYVKKLVEEVQMKK
jgi:excisionase family DNA binding protein